MSRRRPDRAQRADERDVPLRAAPDAGDAHDLLEHDRPDLRARQVGHHERERERAGAARRHDLRGCGVGARRAVLRRAEEDHQRREGAGLSGDRGCRHGAVPRASGARAVQGAEQRRRAHAPARAALPQHERRGRRDSGDVRIRLRRRDGRPDVGDEPRRDRPRARQHVQHRRGRRRVERANLSVPHLRRSLPRPDQRAEPRRGAVHRRADGGERRAAPERVRPVRRRRGAVGHRDGRARRAGALPAVLLQDV